jgi:hypothetical protein
MRTYDYRYRVNPWSHWFAFPMVRYPYRYRAQTRSHETEEAYYMEVWLPGLRKQDIYLKLMGRQLEIEGVRNRHLGFWGMSRTALQRSIVLPMDVDTDRIDAKYRHGRLLIRLTKEGAVLDTWQERDRWLEIEEGYKRAVALVKKGWDRMVSVLKHGL